MKLWKINSSHYKLLNLHSHDHESYILTILEDTLKLSIASGNPSMKMFVRVDEKESLITDMFCQLEVKIELKAYKGEKQIAFRKSLSCDIGVGEDRAQSAES